MQGLIQSDFNSSTPVVVVNQAPAALDITEGEVTSIAGNERCRLLNSLCARYALPLHPGLTGAHRLDKLATTYGWVRFDREVVFHYRPLVSAATPGVVYAKVVHQRSSQDIANDKRIWELDDGCVANPVARDFRVRIPVASMGAGAYINPSNLLLASWLIIWVENAPTIDAEIWLKYGVKVGGAGVSLPPPQTFRVSNGVFEDNQAEARADGSRPTIAGLPAAGRLTGYHFSGSDGPGVSVEQFRDFVSLSGATPRQVERAIADTPAVRPTKDRITYALMDFGDQALEKTANAAAELGAAAFDGLVAKAKDWLTGLPNAGHPSTNSPSGPGSESGAGGNDTSPPPWPDARSLVYRDSAHPFARFSGSIVVTPLDSYSTWVASQPSIPVVIATKDPLAEETEETRGLTDQLVPLVTDALLGLAAHEFSKLFWRMWRTIRRTKKIFHTGTHASQWSLPTWTFGKGETPGPDNNQGLPDLPEFDNDAEAPGTKLDWRGTQQYYQLYVTHDNGVPRIHYCSASRIYQQHSVEGYFFGPPTPMWYEDYKQAWDREKKRYVACIVDVDPKLQHHYLCLEAFTWGDNACCMWNPHARGATYYGTVARFSGITASRSVIQVTNYTEFNSFPALWLGPSKKKYLKSDPGSTFLGCIRLAATSSADVASLFLANYALDDSVTNMTNIGWDQSPTRLVTSTDRNNTRAVTDNDRDLYSPSFTDLEVPYALRGDYPTLDAGPVRVAMMARWDNVNGWWQHVPDCYATATPRGSRWTINCRMDSTLYDGGADDQFCSTSILSVNVPTQWRKSSVCWCLETVSVAGACCALPIELKDGTGADIMAARASWKPMCRTLQGPLAISRWVIPGDAGEVHICQRGDNSQPADAVSGKKDHMYATLCLTMYCLGSRKAAFEWGDFRSFSNYEGEVDQKTQRYYGLTSSPLSPNSPHWDYTTQTITSYAVGGSGGVGRLISRSPCRSADAGWLSSPYPGFNGRSLAGLRKTIYSDDGGVPTGTGTEKVTTVLEPSWEPAPEGPGAAKPEPEPEMPELPEPEPEPEPTHQELVEVIPVEPIDIGPAQPGKGPSLDDKWCLSTWSMGWAQQNNWDTSSSAMYVQDHSARNIAVSINFHDLRGIVPMQTDSIGTYRGRTENHSTTPNWLAMPFGIPAAPSGVAPLSIIMVKDVGAMSWDYTSSVPVLKTDTEWSGLDLFDDYGSGFSGGTYYKKDQYTGLSYGHTHQFRRLSCRIFTSRRLDQRKAEHNASYGAFSVYNRNNKLMIAFEVDMGDPNARYSDILSAFVGLQGLSWKDGTVRLSKYATPERGFILTTFEPFDDAVKTALQMCPPMIEFRGKWHCRCSNYQTYSPLDPDYDPKTVFEPEVLEDPASEPLEVHEEPEQIQDEPSETITPPADPSRPPGEDASPPSNVTTAATE